MRKAARSSSSLETVYEIVDGTRYNSLAAAEKLPLSALWTKESR